MEASSVVDSEANDAGEDSRDVQTSVVLPAYNESGNLEPLVEEIRSVLEDESHYWPYEIVIVDDGSTDRTREIVQELAGIHSEVVGVFLARNFGQSAALKAGIDQAAGEWIVTMDADRQNDPADIPMLLEELAEEYDCVSGWRRDRNDPITKTIPSGVQTRLARWTGPNIHDFGCTLKVYRGAALQDISLYGEGHRYIPAKLYSQGYRITELPVNHRPRTEGRSKYGAKRLFKGFVDLLFHVFWNHYSTRPIHFLGGIGFASFFVGSVIGLHAVFIKYALGRDLAPELLPRLILVVALVLFGLILIMFGFLAEMLTMLHYREREPYRIDEVVHAEQRSGIGDEDGGS